MLRDKSHCVLFAVVLLLITIGNASAQPTQDTVRPAAEATESPLTGATVASIDQLKVQITDAAEIDDEQKKKLLETCQRASEAVTRAVKLEGQTPLDQAAIQEVAAKLKDLQASIAAPAGKLLTEIPDDAALPDLAAALAARQPTLQEFRNRLTTLEAEPARRIERRAAIAADLAGHAAKKAEVDKELATPTPVEESSFAAATRRALLLARLREVIAQAPAWQAELSRYDAEKAVELTSLRIQQAKKEVTRLQNEVEELNKRITSKRSQDARYIAEQLKAFADGGAVPTPYEQPIVGLFAEALKDEEDVETAAETARLAAQNVDVTTDLTKATNDVTAAKKQLESLRALKTRTNDKINRVGLTGAIGLELRRHMRNLDDPRLIRRRCKLRQEEMQSLEFKRLDLEDQAPDFAVRVDVLTQEDDANVQGGAELRLITDRLTTLTTLERNFGELFNRLGELDATEQEFVREVEEFDTFIRERVLWIRSHQLPDGSDFGDVVTTARWFARPEKWTEVSTTLWNDAATNMWPYAMISILMAVLIGVQQRFRRSLHVIGAIAAKRSCREFQPTGRAAVLTLVLALTWPIIPAFISWRLLSDTAASPFVRAVGNGMLAVTAGFATLNLLRHLCRPSGLALSHFDWPTNAVRVLRLRIYSLLFMLLPLLFVETTLHQLENVQGRDAFERIIFIVSLLVLAQFQVKVLHPNAGVFRDYFALNKNGWVFRSRWLFYGIVVAVPIILALLAVVGYFYTAYELSWRLHGVTWALIGLFVVRSFLVRWFVVRHRELRIEQARQRRQALVDSAQAQEGASSTQLPPTKELPVDLQEVSDQTMRLIDSALGIIGLVITWFVWVDVLPALGVLDRWELWPTMVDVTVEFTEASGEKSFRTEPKLESITVADALIAGIIALLTFSAARNIPGFMEITLLNRLPLDPATRYAVRMVARYVIVVAGTILAFGAVGVGWAKVQWLAAALTVGLGFGLQEIFANFISGLIILFERPVRIGDVVTIGDVSGTVSRIQIRATTITDWNRKEYIVPNKEFVTGRLLNWTLSDKTIRVVIDVGVAYGSDTRLAREILLNIAKTHPEVLSDPEPISAFEGFGDSTLNLSLRCFLPNLDNRLTTITELHEAIDRDFKSARIEISFPQRDLHLRTVPEQLSASGPARALFAADTAAVSETNI